MSGVANNVVVFIKAGNCGHCTQLYTVWNSICAEMLKVEKTLKFVVIPLPTMASPIPMGFPKNLKEFCPWYPFIFMVSGKDWAESLKSGNTKFDDGVYYFNAKKLENGTFESVPTFNRDPKGFAEWVKALIKNGGLKAPEYFEEIPELKPKRGTNQVIQKSERKNTPIYSSISGCDEDDDVCALQINVRGRGKR